MGLGRVQDFELLKFLGKGSFGAPHHHPQPNPTTHHTPPATPHPHHTRTSQALSTRRAVPRTRRLTPSRRYRLLCRNHGSAQAAALRRLLLSVSNLMQASPRLAGASAYRGPHIVVHSSTQAWAAPAGHIDRPCSFNTHTGTMTIYAPEP